MGSTFEAKTKYVSFVTYKRASVTILSNPPLQWSLNFHFTGLYRETPKVGLCLALDTVTFHWASKAQRNLCLARVTYSYRLVACI